MAASTSHARWPGFAKPRRSEDAHRRQCSLRARDKSDKVDIWVGYTKKGTQAAGRRVVQAIQPNASGGGPGGAPGPDAEANSAPPIFGQPDFYPDLTFIAHAGDEANPVGFTFQARAFHTASGCNPVMVDSIEDIVTRLAAGAGFINRLRIVSHVFVDPAAQIPEANMMIPFLSGGPQVRVLPSLMEHFAAYAQSDLQGLRAMMVFRTAVGSVEVSPYIHRGDLSTVLSQVTGPAAALVAAVPRDAFGEPGDPLFVDFFRLIASKSAVIRPAFSPTDRASVSDAYDRLIADVLPRLPGSTTAAERGTMRDGVAAVSITAWREPRSLPEYALAVRAALGVLGAPTFASRLARVRQRFNRNSKVDIRGCQIARQPGFLEAIQAFFGTSPTVRPTVSGPEWFQHFNPIGHITGLTPAGIDPIAAGSQGYSASEVTSHLNDWANGFGINAAHLNGWTTALSGGPIEFAALQWAAMLTSTAFPIARLSEIVNASIDTLFPRITAILGVPASAALTTPERNSLRAKATNLQAWSDTLAAPIPAGNLAAHFTALRNVYEGVDQRFAGRVPPDPVIPATIPAGLTAAQLQAMRDALRTFVATDPNSHFRPVKEFMDAALARLTDPRGRLRLYLGLGIPFLLFRPDPPRASDNTLVALHDPATSPNPRQNDAIRYWLRAQWQGLVPDNIGTGATFRDNAHTPWLVEHHQPAGQLQIRPFAVSPTPQYHAHIVTRPA
jgi:hypothetical protein